MINCYIPLMVALIIVNALAAGDIASYQYNLVTTPQVPGNNPLVYLIPVTFPTTYNNTFSRHVVLSGLQFNNNNDIYFEMIVLGGSSDSTDTIFAKSHSPTTFSKMSLTVIFVQTGANWIWVQEKHQIYSQINSLGSTPSFQLFSVTFPSVDLSTSSFRHLLFMTSFRSIGEIGTQNRIALVFKQQSPPSDLVYYSEVYSQQQMMESRIVVILYDQGLVSSLPTAIFKGWQNSGTGFSVSSPTTFGIANDFGSSPYGGFNGNCIIAFKNLYIVGNANLQTRSLLFNISTNPFSDVIVDLPTVAGGQFQSYYASWNILCVQNCAEGTYVSNNRCQSCLINCRQCDNGTTCSACNTSTMALNSNRTACVPCQDLTTTCWECLNSTYCTSCINTSYALAGNICQSCSVLISNCSFCLNSTYCFQCEDTFGLDNNICESCASLIQNCSLCQNNTYCIECLNTSVLNSSNMCEPCSNYLDFCVECVSSSACLLCMNYSYALNTNNTCQLCINLMGNCSLCDSNTSCIACNNTEVAVSINKICQPCPSLISSCVSCTSNTFCLECVNSSFALLSSGSSQLCFLCSVYLPNCVTCNSSTNCTLCSDSRFFIDAGRQCSLCSTALNFCLECNVSISTGQLDCLLCETAYFINSTNRCQSCSVMNFYHLCSNGTYCQVCVSNIYTFRAESNSCQPCNVSFPNCLQCNNWQCTLCPSDMYLTIGNPVCTCYEGNLVTGICTTIIGCLSVLRQPDGSQVCLECNSTSFNSTPINGICKCKKGNLTNGICVEDDGCLSPIILEDGSVLCQFCNISAGFKLLKNAQGQCECQEKLYLSGQNCIQICGDGYLLTRYECDDGNIEDGDGCSSFCTIQANFRCHSGSSISASICVYSGLPLNMSLNSIQKAEEQNQGVFRFDVFPPLFSINKMHLYQHVLLDCNATYQISSINYLNGILQIRADYTTDMEGCNCTVTFSFDQQIIMSPTINLDFQAISENMPLKISSYNDQFSLIKKIFFYLSIAALIVFLLSLPHKTIGVELLSCFQVVYLSNSFYSKASFLFSSVKSFRLVTGYWSLFHQSSDDNLYLPFSQRVQLTEFFIQDSLIVVSVIFVGFIVFFSLKIKQQVNRGQSTIFEKEEKAVCSVFTFQKAVYNFILYPFSTGFLIVLQISSFFSCLRLSSQKPSFVTFINSLSLIFTFFVLGFIFKCQFITSSSSEQQQNQRIGPSVIWCSSKYIKHWYTPLLLIRLFLLVMLINMGIIFSFQIINQIIVATSLLFLLVLICLRPYFQKIDLFGSLLCEATILYSSILPVLSQAVAFEESTQLYLLYSLLGFIILSIFFGFVRTLLLYWKVYHFQSVSPSIAHDSRKKAKRKLTKFEELQRDEAKKMHIYSPFQDYQKRKCLKKTMKTKKQLNKIEQNLVKEQISRIQREEKQFSKIKEKLKDNLLAKRKRENKNID